MIARNLLAIDELADMTRKRNLHVDQVDFAIGRTRPVGALVEEVLDGTQRALRSIDRQQYPLHDPGPPLFAPQHRQHPTPGRAP